MGKSRIAVDVMGGDNAPRAILEGVVRATDPAAADGLPADRVLLVGSLEIIERELEALGAKQQYTIQHASQVIEMDESPAQALRSKPDSSVSVGIGAVQAGAAGAFVSMGNTGAVVGAATLGLGTLPGVRRPGIAVTLNLTGHPITFLDMGANIAPKPEHLLHCAVMGKILTEDVIGTDRHRVGLLNIGEEASKGTALLKAAHELLSNSGLDFIGNLEGGDIFEARCEVLVMDGYTGNVVLKLLEGFAGFMLKLILGELGRAGIQVPEAALASVNKNIDYSEYGGALLMGVNGVVVIGHGRSDARATANALLLAGRAIDRNLNEHIVQGLAGERPKSAEESA